MLDAETPAIIPINLQTGKVLTKAVLVCKKMGDPGCTPTAIAISANGKDAYVAAAGSADALEVALPSLKPVRVLPTGGYPDAVAVSGTWLFRDQRGLRTTSRSSATATALTPRADRAISLRSWPGRPPWPPDLAPATTGRPPAQTESPNPAQPFYGVTP